MASSVRSFGQVIAAYLNRICPVANRKEKEANGAVYHDVKLMRIPPAR
jgi:hypothetical protein